MVIVVPGSENRKVQETVPERWQYGVMRKEIQSCFDFPWDITRQEKQPYMALSNRSFIS